MLYCGLDLGRRSSRYCIVVDPNQTKAIGASLIKHDKLDARVLAQLAAADLLAEVRIPTLQQRLDRMPPTARDVLVRSRTRIVNCIRSMLASEGFVLPHASPKRLVALLDASPPPDIPPALYEALVPLLEALQDGGRIERLGGLASRWWTRPPDATSGYLDNGALPRRTPGYLDNAGRPIGVPDIGTAAVRVWDGELLLACRQSWDL